MTFGYSLDDVGKFLPVYLAHGLLQHDPFECIADRFLKGVGQLIKTITEKGRAREERIYYSSDSVSITDVDFNVDESLYTSEFLNSIRMSGIPHHELVLKMGCTTSSMARSTTHNVEQDIARMYDLRMIPGVFGIVFV
ncbi:pyruvate, phosphate dikinase, chloroplastic [Artemisia annua]|uniref:Pyruvate, phosphate dikinase, chloroplastic n=1 Tax=Artemisia annua TaxID=35608 RepID=A0A2U1M4U0_ARTAN|nr:pyruvate, phosphate dikinase, chloroplastic [Artemisia annua]